MHVLDTHNPYIYCRGGGRVASVCQKNYRLIQDDWSEFRLERNVFLECCLGILLSVTPHEKWDGLPKEMWIKYTQTTLVREVIFVKKLFC